MSLINIGHAWAVPHVLTCTPRRATPFLTLGAVGRAEIQTPAWVAPMLPPSPGHSPAPSETCFSLQLCQRPESLWWRPAGGQGPRAPGLLALGWGSLKLLATSYHPPPGQETHRAQHDGTCRLRGSEPESKVGSDHQPQCKGPGVRHGRRLLSKADSSLKPVQ